MDIDTIVGPPHAEWMRGAPPQVAIIRMFGVTAAGVFLLTSSRATSCATLLTPICAAPHRKQRVLPHTRLSAVLLRRNAFQLCS